MAMEAAAPTVGTSLYETCQELFDDYPVAVGPVSQDGAVRLMVLMTPSDTSLFVLTHVGRPGSEPFFRLHSRGTEGEAVIRPDGSAEGPVPAWDVLGNCTPVPGR
jgi:hypothetical protein